ncbi:outer membrane lipoprotein carrier protein LolA [Cytobacillus praedii]|uniref:Outer membrane lipoprotein carrier protein LolA n=2 Tax=Cytobacillus praedii TaxID=1742358 RepID=A0A4R1AZH9_9BACI|nr:outer membrane lipoprotein carrier protein LolA [Cytobacillus praedii]
MKRMEFFKSLKVISAAAVMSISLVACSTEGNEFSPEQVVQNALADNAKMPAYYGESVMKFNDGTGKMELKEWVSEDGKRRTEAVMPDTGEKSITVNDGNELISFDEAANTAFVIDMKDNTLMNMSPKEQAEMLLNAIKDTHSIKLVGEEKMIGRDVYHLKAEAKDENTLYGDQEIWVDKENWFVLKSTSASGDIQVSVEYKKIEFNPTLKDSLFTLELPKDVEMKDISAMTEEKEVQSLEKAVEIMEKPFLYVQEKNGLKIEQMTVMSGGSDVNPELSLTYFKDNLPYFSLSIFAIEEENKEFDGEGINIRGLKGDKTEIKDFRLLNWAEDGFGYSVIISHPELTFEEMNKIIEEMGYVEVK